MFSEQAHIFNDLNKRFYESHGSSFSESRNAPWDGWSRVLEHIVSSAKGDTISALDIACGNGRFEIYACAEYPDYNWSFMLIDSDYTLLKNAKKACEDGGIQAQFEQMDVLDDVLKRLDNYQFAHDRRYSAVVSFGFMHHISSQENRIRFIEKLTDAVIPGGIVALSMWRFADNESMALKAKESTKAFCEQEDYRLEKGDYLLGWQGMYDNPRYCHSFSDEDVDEIIKSLPTTIKLIDRFRSDGRDSHLNEYLVLRRI